MASERIPRSRPGTTPTKLAIAHTNPHEVCGGVNVKKVGCRKSTFSRYGALSASWLTGDPRGEHVQSMGHARCRRGSEVLRYVQKTSRVPHK